MASAKAMGFVGGGNMAEALVKGVARNDANRRIVVSEPRASRRAELEKLGGTLTAVATAAEMFDADHDYDAVVLAVKPQKIPDVLRELAEACSNTASQPLWISVAAGISIKKLRSGLGEAARVVRAMPNTPALVGQGASAFAAGRGCTAGDRDVAQRLFDGVGIAMEVDEEQLDAVTGLSGSGPAYVFRLMEALVLGGTQVGLAPELALRLATQTIAGAAALQHATGRTPEALRIQVSSPGGTTVAGLAAMDGAGFLEAVASGVVAATERSRALGRGEA